MSEGDIRWKQRFEHFEMALVQLTEAVETENPSALEKAGIIQIFEFTFELAWKTLKDYLVENEVPVKFPKEIIKEAFAHELIENGDVWMDMLEKRNLMSHTYSQQNANIAYRLIVFEYFIEISSIYQILKKEL